MTSAGRCTCSIVNAIVAVLPLPVTPRRVWKRSPSFSPSDSSLSALGWSATGRYAGLISNFGIWPIDASTRRGRRARAVSTMRSEAGRGLPEARPGGSRGVPAGLQAQVDGGAAMHVGDGAAAGHRDASAEQRPGEPPDLHAREEGDAGATSAAVGRGPRGQPDLRRA